MVSFASVASVIGYPVEAESPSPEKPKIQDRSGEFQKEEQDTIKLGLRLDVTEQTSVEEPKDSLGVSPQLECSKLSHTPYRFALCDVPAWRKHLQDEGYVVLAAAMTPEEVKTAKDLLWSDLEAHYGISRADPETWKKWTLSRTGGLETAVVQDPGAWYVRACPGVKRAFEDFWETSEPCMVPLLPVTPATGGLQVIPQSHTEAAKAETWRQTQRLTHGVSTTYVGKLNAVLLLAEPGDLILWDSRTIHGGHVGRGYSDALRDLARMSLTVCMVPRSRATAEASCCVLEARRQGYLRGRIFNHAPHEAGTSNGTLRSKGSKTYRLEDLTPAQQALL
eukprot:Skav208393  [mRNA]  locus=scaffold1179:88308:92958:- [translate_table: standard]